MTTLKKIALFSSLLPLVLAAPAVERQAAPSVQFSYATVVGSSFGGIDSFNGIPFAQPPVGQLRLKPPKPITTTLGTVHATGIPRACPQFYSTTDSDSLPLSALGLLLDTPLVQTVTDAGEDCLTINVQRPSSATAGSNLPVIFWIFGGGFELGSTQIYSGSSIISTSVAKGKPIIFVAVNYRVGGFGFLPGKEVLADGSTNLGLLDQRLGLQWVADNIAKFGGDPTKVTIWGESAGAISVFDQMVLYNGNNTYKSKPLFRAAIMESGSLAPANPVDCPKGQAVYDTVVTNAGCSGASDTLACLRGLDYTTYLNAANSVPGIFSYSSLALSYLPRPDGTALTASPDVLIASGQYAQVPFIVGDQEDEGTLFSLVQSNISTTADIVNYLSSIYFHDATVSQVQALVDLYPDDPSAGSPFGTGIPYNIYPQFKRLAAILGDITFTITRRAFLTVAAETYPSVPSWSYLGTYDYGVPVLGTFHGSDILQAFGITPSLSSATMQTYYISFINNLDPNQGTVGLPTWPNWSATSPKLMNFQALANTLLPDTFRDAVYQFILENAGTFHI
jgi:carboxylesterase type B